jgi:RHS repeat-associated protein
MTLPGRTTTGNDYRYGFNGKEKDDELKGIGNSYDFGARMLDPRVGRWFAVDKMRMKAPEWSPYRFGFDNPIRYKDPDGNWEEDGHFWTVLAYGLAKGLKYETAFMLAKGAESLDHKVHSNFKMFQTDGKTSFARQFGLGTWADGGCNHMSGGTQQFGHALTGEKQEISRQFSIEQILSGNLVALHTLGDSWAHSYVNDEGVRMNYGRPTGFTIQHASEESTGYLVGREASKIDNIYTRNDVYNSYLDDLDKTISTLYKLELGFDHSIHDYVMQNGITKENNIFLFKSYAEIKSGIKKFSEFNSNDQFNLLKGYLDKMGIKYKVKTITYTLPSSNKFTTDASFPKPIKIKSNNYKIKRVCLNNKNKVIIFINFLNIPND